MIRRFCFFAAVSLGTLAAERLTNTTVSIDERIAVIQRRFQQAPDDAAVRDALAGAFLQKMRETGDGAYLERAAQLVTGILRADPGKYEARRRELEIEMHRHHFTKVIALSAELGKEKPEDTVVWGLRGDAYMELGEYDRAADEYQKMVDLRPSLASYNRVAFYRFVTGDAEGAIHIMRQAIGIGSPEPENQAWCLTELGDMLLKAGRTDEAEQAYDEALALFPGSHHALAGQGRVRAARGKFREAIPLFIRAQAKVPLPEYSGMLAKLYRKIGDDALARKQVALLDVTDKMDRFAGQAANRKLALALADLEHRVDRALELARAELEVRRDVYTYDALAWALYRNGKISEAEAAMQKALSQNTPEPSFHYHAACIYETLGRTDEARRHQAEVQYEPSAF